MAAYLRSENPTGRYHLNLSRQLERVIAQRLLMQAQAEHLWRASRVYVNFRNVVLEGEPIEIADPINFVIPAAGFIRFDFIVYDKGAARFSDGMTTANLASCGRVPLFEWRQKVGKG
jgi:hypothetical protein